MARQVVSEVQVEWAAALGHDRLDLLLGLLAELAARLGARYAESISELGATDASPARSSGSG